MRKVSREMSAEWALEVFDKAPYITVSMTGEDGVPYGLPLSLVRTDEKTFWFHCATEGSASFELFCNAFRNELSVCIGMFDFHDVDAHFLVAGNKFFNFFLDFFNACTCFADEHCRACGVDCDYEFICRSFEHDF